MVRFQGGYRASLHITAQGAAMHLLGKRGELLLELRSRTAREIAGLPNGTDLDY